MDQPHVLKPTIALHAISLAVLFGSLVFISGSIASLFVLWDPCAVLGGVVFLPISLAFGVNQYRGTYHRNRAAANLTAILLFGSGGTIAFGFGILLGQVLLRGGDIQGTPFLLSFAFSAFCLIAGWMNLQWSRRLVQAGVSAQNMDLRGQFTLREMLFAVLALSVVTILVAGAVRSTPRQFAEHVARDEAPLDLPTSARDVCFCQGSRGTIACEFTCDEGEFRAWVAARIGSLESDAANVPIRTITAPYTIQRYFALRRDLTGPESITITKGLFYNWACEDRGVYAAYDSTTGRAYHYRHSH